MNKTRSLYKAFSSNLEMPKPTGEKKVKLYNRFGMIAFIGIMVPVSIVIGYVTYALTNLMYGFDGNAYGLLTEIDLISAFAMVFGMPLMFSVLFFSSDLQFLTALPVTPGSLYAARFWHTFKAENVMTSNVLFAIYIGYFISAIKNAGIKEALHPVALIASVVGFFGSLLIPLIYCSIIALLLMLVLKRFNRVSIYYYTSIVVFVAFAVMFLLSFEGYGKISVINYLNSLVVSDNNFTSICNILFPTNYLTTMAIENHSVLPLIGSVLIIAALYMLSVLVAHLTYRKGLFAAAVISNKKRHRKSSFSYKKRGVSASLLSKEIKVLTRNMTYRMNCVFANLIWPIAAVIFIIEAPKFEFFKLFRAKLAVNEPVSHIILFGVFIAMAFIGSGLNSIASTSFTREGVHLDMLKYLPADLGKQIRAKVWVAILFTFIPVACAVASVTVFFGVSAWLPLYIITAFVCILTATMIGVIMDSISPYTVWSDELSALRGNLNCFFNLAAELIAALFAGGVLYGTYLLTKNSVITISVVAAILVVASVLIVITGLPRVRKNIESLK
jgi:ABC-2 type transport system permease protein